jgi:hypothetical protein
MPVRHRAEAKQHPRQRRRTGPPGPHADRAISAAREDAATRSPTPRNAPPRPSAMLAGHARPPPSPAPRPPRPTKLPVSAPITGTRSTSSPPPPTPASPPWKKPVTHCASAPSGPGRPRRRPRRPPAPHRTTRPGPSCRRRGRPGTGRRADNTPPDDKPHEEDIRYAGNPPGGVDEKPACCQAGCRPSRPSRSTKE